MIDNVEKYQPQIYGILGFICLAVFFLQRTPFLDLSISTATPVLLVPMVVVIACFLKEWTGFWFGFASGVALDVFSADSRIFNTVVLMLIGTLSGLLFHFLFNRNIKSAIIGGFIFSFLYVFLRWIFLTVFLGDGSMFLMLVKYEIPSAVYTALFVIPIFYIVKKLCKRYIIHNN